MNRNLQRLRAVRAACKNGTARAVRLHNGLTQAEIAKAVGCSQSSIALWESAQRVPRGDPALRYADVLDGLSHPPTFAFTTPAPEPAA